MSWTLVENKICNCSHHESKPPRMWFLRRPPAAVLRLRAPGLQSCFEVRGSQVTHASCPIATPRSASLTRLFAGQAPSVCSPTTATLAADSCSCAGTDTCGHLSCVSSAGAHFPSYISPSQPYLGPQHHELSCTSPCCTFPPRLLSAPPPLHLPSAPPPLHLPSAPYAVRTSTASNK